MHDPLWQMHHRDLDRMLPTYSAAKIRGIACTGIWRWPDFLNAHPARKVVLHRPISEVRASMTRLGLPELPENAAEMLGEVDAMRIDYRALFAPRHARKVWQHLTGGAVPFDERRHARLVEMRIEPALDRVDRRERYS